MGKTNKYKPKPSLLKFLARRTRAIIDNNFEPQVVMSKITNDLKKLFFNIKHFLYVAFSSIMVYDELLKVGDELMTIDLIDETLKKDFEVLLTLKLKELRGDNFKEISRDMLKSYLFDTKWKKRSKLAISDLANDIFDVTASEIFEYLQNVGIKNSIHLSLEDFNDLITK